MTVLIRKFQEEDVPLKVKWINSDENNKYLHYDLPLSEEKTLQWFRSLKGRNNRVDYTITYKGEPAGLIGLLNIDQNKKEAEYYICMGGNEFKGKGIAKTSTELLIEKAFNELELESINLYTEVENIQAQKFFERSGFIQKSLIKGDLIYNGKKIDRFYYVLDRQNLGESGTE